MRLYGSYKNISEFTSYKIIVTARKNFNLSRILIGSLIINFSIRILSYIYIHDYTMVLNLVSWSALKLRKTNFLLCKQTSDRFTEPEHVHKVKPLVT